MARPGAVFPSEIDPLDLAWVAGLFEGEGYFAALPDGSLSVVIRMTDRDVLERVQRIMGGKLHGPYRPGRTIDKPHYKAVSQWTARGRDYFEQFCAVVGPLLGERRQARIAEIAAMRTVAA